MDYDKLKNLITDKTKVIMPVDYAGYPADYNRIKEILKELNREDIIISVDSAHSFGATIREKK